MGDLICYQCWVDGLYEVFNPAAVVAEGKALCERHARDARVVLVGDHATINISDVKVERHGGD